MPLPPYLSILIGDLTQRPVDAVVNAANNSLMGGGGVNRAIHRAAGQERLQSACLKLGGCPTGGAKATPGFDLPARWIIHAVGPVWLGGREGEPAYLASAYLKSLGLAAELGCGSIAFPAISCGAYGYPAPMAAPVAREAIESFQKGSKALKKIELVFVDHDMLETTWAAWSP
ncbi:MAG TPA: macro domain-containing protein [bacterium]|jgi:O-acetyl-ADP-ribose deacetylase (regulator of RNase III)|nr:macro domain-containing protein [bacterium]